MGATCIPRAPVSSQGPCEREGEGQRQSQTGGAELMAVRTQGGAVSQGCGASRPRKFSHPSLGVFTEASPSRQDR